MSNNFLLPSAPIKEAIIDIQITPLEGTFLPRLKSLQPENYPICKPCIELSGEIQVSERVSTTTTHQELGYIFSSLDHPYILQVRIDGFTLSRLRPYDCWETFSREAQTLWQKYRTLIGAQEIKRLAVRYINSIDLPLPVTDLSKFFRTRPEISDKMDPRDVSGFLMFLQMPQTDIGAMLNFRQGIVSPATGEKGALSVILDIDIYRDKEVPQQDQEIWEYFDSSLRQRKDEIFFSSLTEETEQMLRSPENCKK